MSSGYRYQSQLRWTFRILGLGALSAAITMIIRFVRQMSATSFDAPEPNVLLMFGGIGLLFVALVFLNFGFGGAAARYAAGEGLPIVKDGLADLGIALDTPPPDGTKSCPTCNMSNDADARFCDSCGAAFPK